MNNLFNISEAATLGFHAMALMSIKPEMQFTTKDLANIINCSEAHLSKVLQRLAKANLVDTTRGPNGGYNLKLRPEEISLWEIYKVIDGDINCSGCLLKTSMCQKKSCMFGGLFQKLTMEFLDYMKKTNLSHINRCSWLKLIAQAA